MRSPELSELPPAPSDRSGWPWTEATAPRDAAPSGGWPPISIVIPSYNQGRYVEETLRSVLLQAYPELEVIVCDDGSDDETPRILERYGGFLRLSNEAVRGGMSRAINRGFARASGEIVTWVSTDDVYLPGAFLTVAERHRGRPECAALIGGFQFIDASSRPIGPPRPARLDLETPADLSVAPVESWRLHQVATFYTAAGLEAAGRRVREDLDYVMDRELLFRVCSEGRICLVDDTLARFRIHPASKSWSSRQILAFAAEFAALQDDFMTGDPGDDARRRAIKTHRMVKGYLRCGTQGERLAVRISALLAAARLSPRLLRSRSYAARWPAALGLARPLRRLLGRDEKAPPEPSG